MSDLEIRYAESDQDVVAIHQFLCVVAHANLPGPINGPKSAFEVWRVVNDPPGEDGRRAGCFALMAIKRDRLIGTIGIIRAEHWWGDITFLANRWCHVLPGEKCVSKLLKEAKAIAVALGLELHIYDEQRGRLMVLNRSKRRPSPTKN